MLNKIMLIGNLGKDPEMNYTPSGRAVTKFSLAVNRRWKDRESGEPRDETTWFYIVAWDRLAEQCTEYLRKGRKVYIEGRMTSRKYTNKDGVDVTAWEVNATDMQMLDSRSDAQGQGAQRGGDMSGDVGADDIPF